MQLTTNSPSLVVDGTSPEQSQIDEPPNAESPQGFVPARWPKKRKSPTADPLPPSPATAPEIQESGDLPPLSLTQLSLNSMSVIKSIADVPSIWQFPAELDWLVEGAIPSGTVTLLSAESGTGKSWVAYGLAGAVAQGKPFAGLTVQRRPVVYFDGENPAAVVKDRLNELGIPEIPTLTVWGGWVEEEPPPGPDDPRVIEFAREKQGLLIWDSLVEFNPGDEMNATEMRRFMKKFRFLGHLGATVLVLAHTGKSATSHDYRGSSDIKAGVDTAYRLDTIEQKDGKIHRLRLINFKSRAAAGRNFGLEFKPGEGFVGFSLSGKNPKNHGALLTAIIEEHGELNGVRLKDIAKDTHGIAKHAVDEFLKTWPHQRKGAKGHEKLYHSGLLPLAA
jgi:archaellum biogenesis ATPase FlaH